MSSDLCIKKEEPPKKNTPPSGPTKKPDPGPIDRIIENKSLRSKHLKIVSEELYIAPTLQDAGGLGEGVQTGEGSQAGGASLAGTDAGLENTSIVLGGRQTPIGRGDVIRGNFLNYFGKGLEAVKKGNFDSTSFTQAPNSEEMEFDVKRADEGKARELFDNIKSIRKENPQYTYINFTLDVPFSEAEIQANTIQSGRPEKDDPGFVGGDPRISTYKFEPRYNFFIKKYENKLKNQNIDIRAIPNAHVYDFLLESLFDLDVTSYDKEYLKYLSYQPDENKLLLNVALKKYNFTKYLREYITTPEVKMTNKFIDTTQPDKFTNLVVTQDDAAEYFRSSGKLRSTANYGYYLEIPYEPPRMQSGEKDIFKNIFKVTNTDLNLYNVVIKTNFAKEATRYNFQNTEGIGQGVQTGFEAAEAGGASVAGTDAAVADTTLAIGGRQTPLDNSPGKDDAVLLRAFGFGETANLTPAQRSTLKSLMPRDKSYYTNLSYIEATKNLPVNNFTTSPTKYKTWDLTAFFEKYEQFFDSFKGSLKDAFILNKDKYTVIVGESNEAIQKYKTGTAYDAFQKLMNKVADQQFKKGVKDNNIKNVSSMFNQLVETPYEVLFYRVQKRDSRNLIVQNYYLPNPDESGRIIDSKDKLIKLFDNQIKYGENHTFEVFAYPLVLAKKYHYEKVNNNLRFPESPPLSNDFFVVFNFLKYYLDNITRVRTALQATKTEMDKYLNQFKDISNKIIDEAFVLQLALGAKGKNYQTFINTMKTRLKNMVQQIVDIVNKNVRTVGNDTELFNKTEASTNIRKYFFRNPVTDPEPNWMYSVQEYEKAFMAQLKSEIAVDDPTLTKSEIETEYYDLLNSYTLLSRVIGGLLTDNGAYSSYDASSASKSFATLSRYTKVFGTFDDGVEFDKFKIVTEDYIPLMEIPIFSVSAKILDGPPVAPKVSFVPYKDVNNKVMIKLKGENTEYYEVPQFINQAEEEMIKELVNTRGTDKQGRLLYKTDDYLSKFEIFRTDVRPRSYRDFSGKVIKRVNLEEKYSSYNHLDNIEPNKKYYYTFRSYDAHDNFSNPSPVYEFILNDDSGFLYPEVRIIQFDDTDYYSLETSMQRYIQIRPSAQNIIFDPELVNDEVKSAKDLAFVKSNDTNPPLGIADNPVWGKNFKLRITSKTSGKKVDINFTFTKKHKIVEKPDAGTTPEDRPLPLVALYNGQ